MKATYLKKNRKLRVDDDLSWRMWHLECKIQCGLFKAGGTNSSRLLPRKVFGSLFLPLSFYLFLSILNKRKEIGRSFLFLFSIVVVFREICENYFFVFFLTWRDCTKNIYLTNAREIDLRLQECDKNVNHESKINNSANKICFVVSRRNSIS